MDPSRHSVCVPDDKSEVRYSEDDLGKTGFILNALSDIFDRYRYIPAEELERLAGKAGVSMKVLKTICARSDSYSTERVGDRLIVVCDGTVCHNRHAPDLIQALTSILGIKPGETTPDGRYTLRTAACVGNCDEAPVMIVDGEKRGRVKLAEVRKQMKG